MDEVRELNWIFDEEDWCIVSNHIVVAFFSVELNSETSGVSDAIGRADLTSDGRESQEERCSLSDGVEELSLGEFAYIVGNLEEAVSAGSLSVDDSLGDSLSIELCEFVDQVEVLKEQRASGASSHRELVVVNWHARASG